MVEARRGLSASRQADPCFSWKGDFVFYKPGIGRPSKALLPPIASARAKTPPVAISTLEVTSQHCRPQRFVGVLMKYRIESSDSMRTHEELVGSSQWSAWGQRPPRPRASEIFNPCPQYLSLRPC